MLVQIAVTDDLARTYEDTNLAKLLYGHHGQWRLVMVFCKSLQVPTGARARACASLGASRRAQAAAALLAASLRIMTMMAPHYNVQNGTAQEYLFLCSIRTIYMNSQHR